MAQINLKNTDTPQTPSSGRTGLFIKVDNSPVLITDDGTEIPLGGTSLDQAVIDALNAAQSPTDENPYITLSELNSILGQTSGIVYGGSVQWSGTGLVFDISATGYFLDGLFYEEPAGQVTLDAADATNDRIDVFVVDSAGFNKVTGTPSATPVKPSINPVTQIELSFVEIPATATTPTVTNEDIYLENTEWVTSSAGTGTFDPDSTTDPFAGTKAFEVTNIENGGQMIFTRASDIDLTGYNSIGLHIKLKNTMNNGRNVFAQFFDNSDNPLTNQIALPLTKSNSSTYQFTSIDFTSFTFSDITIVRKLKLTYNGKGGAATYDGYFVDNVIAQDGVDNEAQGGVESFLGLTDTPSSYSGESLKAVRVNSGETALEFYTPSAGGTFIGDSDTPANYTGAANQFLRVNATPDAVVFDTVSPYDLDQEGASDGDVLTWSTANSRYEPQAGGGGGSSLWTDATTFIYRDSKVVIGRTTLPSEATFAVQSKQTTLSHDFIQFINNAGNTVFAMEDRGYAVAIGNSISTNKASLGTTIKGQGSGSVAQVHFRVIQQDDSISFDVRANKTILCYGANNLFGNPTTNTAGNGSTFKGSASSDGSQIFRVNNSSDALCFQVEGDGDVEISRDLRAGDPTTNLASFGHTFKGRLSSNNLNAIARFNNSADTIVLDVMAAGGVVMPNLPTSDPVYAGALWNDSGTLKISAG